MGRALVLGGSGFIGSRLAARLARRLEVVATSTRGAPAGGGVEGRAWMTSDAPGLERLVREEQPELVVAAFSQRGDVRPYTPDERERDIEATALAARLAAGRGARFVLLSSGSVFETGGGPSAEERPPAVVTEYGRFKAGQERVVLASHPRPLIVRFCQVLGRDARYPTRFERLAAALGRGERVERSGDASTNDIEVRDLVEAIDLLDASDATPRIVHLGSTDGATLAQFARRVAVHVGASPSQVVALSAGAPCDCRLLTDLARTLLPARLFASTDELIERALASPTA